MKNFIKKQGLGTWISLGTILLAVIGLIVYGVALSGGMDLVIAGQGTFFTTSLDDAAGPGTVAMMTNVTACGIIALLFLVGAIVLDQFKFEGTVGTVCTVLAGAMRVVAAALLMTATLYFAYGSLNGLGWTFFSNEELEIEAAATAVGTQVIVGLVFLGISSVAAVVASFFKITKKEKKTAEAVAA